MSLLRATVCLCLLLGLALAAPPLELDAEGFKQAMAEEEPVFVKFFAPWYARVCIKMHPSGLISAVSHQVWSLQEARSNLGRTC